MISLTLATITDTVTITATVTAMLVTATPSLFLTEKKERRQKIST